MKLHKITDTWNKHMTPTKKKTKSATTTEDADKVGRGGQIYLTNQCEQPTTKQQQQIPMLEKMNEQVKTIKKLQDTEENHTHTWLIPK